MRYGFWLAILAVVIALPVAVVSQKRPIVAVFDIENLGTPLKRETLRRLGDYLSARLAETGVFDVVPREQVRLRLIEQKKESYKTCYEQSCQIEIGKALAADKTLATKVLKIGSSCEVTSALYDLERETTDAAATAEASCGEDGIKAGLKEVVERIASQVASRMSGSVVTDIRPADGVVAPPPEVDSGGPRVKKGQVKEANGDLTVSARTPGGTPVRLEIKDPTGRVVTSGSPYKEPRAKIGRWIVTARATGHEEVTQEFQVPPDEPTLVKLELRPLGGLRVTGEPSGALVKVTGPSGFSDEGGLPWEAEGLKSGTYRVEVRRQGYQPFVQEVVVEAGSTATVSVKLAKEGAVTGFVLIPAGSFLMGSPDDEPGRDSDEGPVHRVRITRPFLLKATEVTQGEWRALMGNNPSYFEGCGDTCPVEEVSWWDAVAYCNALSRKEGLEECYELSGCSGVPGEGSYKCSKVRFRGLMCKGYRLPTEAEWEYAARAGTDTALYTGPIKILGANNAPALDPIAWYGGNSGVTYSGGWDCSEWGEKQYSSSRCGTHPVGKKMPNAFGLYDMLGNVWEWVWDWYGDYPSGEVTDPLGPDTGSNRVARGGSGGNIARYVRAADRNGGAPGSRDLALGFRPARGAPTPP